MDNGRGGRAMSAKELTAEIERETNAEVEDFVVENTETDVNRSEMQETGRRILTGEQVASSEIVRDEAELERPLEFVGEESAIQRQERLADDAEDLVSENGDGLGFVDKIVATNQEAIARAIVPEVNKIINRKSFRPAELLSLYRQGTNKTLGVFNRKIGGRN